MKKIQRPKSDPELSRRVEGQTANHSIQKVHQLFSFDGLKQNPFTGATRCRQNFRWSLCDCFATAPWVSSFKEVQA